MDQMMELDMEVHHHAAMQSVSALTTVADALAGLGIVAAVLGVVITMGSLGGPPEEIGKKVAAALVGTFLGILLCYGFVGPVAANLAKLAGEEKSYYQVLRVCIMSFIKGTPPIVAVEMGRRLIPGHVRPTFHELESLCRNKQPAGPAAPAAEKKDLMSPQNPIIVVKKVEGHGGSHGAWKVAYADFVTAMMALFIVLWLLNTSKQIQEAVGGYFKDPTGTSKKVGNGKTGAGDFFTATKENMNELKEQLQATIHKMPILDKLKEQIEITVTPEGLRVELMESANGAFFPSGVAEPNGDWKQILTLLAHELGQVPNTISIEGHTDAKPFAPSANYSNWELSSDRANSARRVMQQTGLGPKQVTQVRGYADQRLRNPNDPEDPANRRIRSEERR